VPATPETLFDPLPEPELPDLRGRPWNTVVAGVGGTGVLTITSLIAMAAHIEGKGCEVGARDCDFLDATRIATALLGDAIGANLFLLGVAWQRGLVPVSRGALERAIELNGVAVAFNKQAFLCGRRYAHQPERVLAGLPAKRLPARLDARSLIEDRAGRLEDYQDRAYADRFRARMTPILERDPEAAEPDSLTAVIARSLYKLMAYKDEYEVARLYTDPAFQAVLDDQFEGTYKVRLNLAPPLLARRDPGTGEPRERALMERLEGREAPVRIVEAA